MKIGKIIRYFQIFLKLVIYTLPILSLANFFPAFAQEITVYDGAYQNCQFSPTQIPPGGSVTFTITTSSAVKLATNTIVENRTNGKSYPSSVAPGLDETSATTTRTLTLGPFYDLGNYYVRSIDLHSPGYLGKCEIYPAFTVNDSSSPITLVEPKSPILQTDMKTLPTLSISGLTPGWQYKINLWNWKGDNLDADRTNGDNSGTQEWTAVGGTITANNICNNGQANRTDCTEIFGSQRYGLTIVQLDGKQVKYLEFQVGTLLSGENPCVGAICRTALGDIPTDPATFTGKLLAIATGIAGGIALIIMVRGAIKILMAAGDPQKINDGRDMIVGAVAGLLFLIFSVLILRFLGSDLLGLFKY